MSCSSTCGTDLNAQADPVTAELLRRTDRTRAAVIRATKSEKPTSDEAGVSSTRMRSNRCVRTVVAHLDALSRRRTAP